MNEILKECLKETKKIIEQVDSPPRWHEAGITDRVVLLRLLLNQKAIMQVLDDIMEGRKLIQSHGNNLF